MKNKKWLLLLIIVFPSFFWLILETSTINSKKLPHYGPKKLAPNGDTVFYQVTDRFFSVPVNQQVTPMALNRNDFPVYAIMFISRNYRPDSYRLTGLWEYLNYKKSKVEHIPFVLVTESEDGVSPVQEELKKLGESKNVRFLSWQKSGFDSLNKTYFDQKPYYTDYSFFVLVDADRTIRGYYDGRYVAEIKRLIDEYKHLRLKEEKQKLIQTNEIKKES